MWAGTGGKALQAPFAVFEHINDYLTAEWVHPPEEIKNAVKDAQRSYLDEPRPVPATARWTTQAEAIPAPFRGIHQVAKTARRRSARAGDEAERGQAGQR